MERFSQLGPAAEDETKEEPDATLTPIEAPDAEILAAETGGSGSGGTGGPSSGDQGPDRA